MPEQPHTLILASQSPQRRQLLAEAGYAFDVITPDAAAECGARSDESAWELVSRLAQQKAADVAHRVQVGVVLGCDTVAECDRRILGKPANRQHAGEMLRSLRGNVHHVYSGVCLWRRPDDKNLVKVDVTRLFMEPVSEAALDEYLDSNAWAGKAGAFGYQDRVGWLKILSGSESNVIGLPMELLARMLREMLVAG